RSVHNVRIERLWVDVTAQVTEVWRELFYMLELQYGLNINNDNHLWLLHHLFLPAINQQLDFFADAWNNHRIQIRNGPSHSPIDMFVFDMLALGVRGNELELTDEELETYGIDWEAFNDDRIRHHQNTHIPSNEASTSWIGQSGPPPNLNQVIVDPPAVAVFEQTVIHRLDELVSPWVGSNEVHNVTSAWVNALTFLRVLYDDEF
ncbi:hypothetical protein C8J56DRAFT_797974, partial [Mycena floridula]